MLRLSKDWKLPELDYSNKLLCVCVCRYNLLFYINPQFYGYSAITKVLLKDFHLKCEYESKLSCISTDGNAVLATFDFDSVNPYGNLVVSMKFLVCLCSTPTPPLAFALFQSPSCATLFRSLIQNRGSKIEQCIRSYSRLLLPIATVSFVGSVIYQIQDYRVIKY